jgi:hypothetical protein
MLIASVLSVILVGWLNPAHAQHVSLRPEKGQLSGTPGRVAPAALGVQVPGTPIVLGSTAPDFRARDATGQEHTLGALSGNVVIDYCAVWCEPCKSMSAGAPYVARQLGLDGKPFTYLIVLLQNDKGDPTVQKDAMAYAAMFDLPTSVPVLHLGGEPVANATQTLQEYADYDATAGSPPAFPTLVFIKDGKVTEVHVGTLSVADIVSRFASKPSNGFPYGEPGPLGRIQTTIGAGVTADLWGAFPQVDPQTNDIVYAIAPLAYPPVRSLLPSAPPTPLTTTAAIDTGPDSSSSLPVGIVPGSRFGYPSRELGSGVVEDYVSGAPLVLPQTFDPIVLGAFVHDPRTSVTLTVSGTSPAIGAGHVTYTKAVPFIRTYFGQRLDGTPKPISDPHASRLTFTVSSADFALPPGVPLCDPSWPPDQFFSSGCEGQDSAGVWWQPLVEVGIAVYYTKDLTTPPKLIVAQP